jgi:Cu/Ag efflux pump CusA
VVAPPTVASRISTNVAGSIRSIIRELPEVRDVISQTGRPDDGTDVNGFDTIEFFVTLTSPEKWTSAQTLDGLTQILQKKLSQLDGLEISFSQPIKDNVDEAISGVKGELVIKIFGPKAEELQELGEQIVYLREKLDAFKDTPDDKNVKDLTMKEEPKSTFPVVIRVLLSVPCTDCVLWLNIFPNSEIVVPAICFLLSSFIVLLSGSMHCPEKILRSLPLF